MLYDGIVVDNKENDKKEMGKGIITTLCIVFVIFSQFSSCQSTPSSNIEAKGPLYSGEGGKNLRFTVLQPNGINLDKNEQWLLPYIQGTLTNDFKTYSAMTVLDRQNLDKILENQNLAASGYFSDDDFISIGSLTNAQFILIGNLEKIAINSFVIDISISDATTGEIRAAFSPTVCSYNDLQDLSVVNKAAEELLTKMGIELTELGRNRLYNTVSSNMGAEIALSKGIEAQKNGSIGQALSYYYNAVSFQPTLTEAKNRLSIISNNVSTGNIGENARNAIAFRNAWKKILDECDVFFMEHFPFDIIYDSRITQANGINYHSESVDLKMEIQVKPSELFNIIQDVLKGLNKTKKKNEWGFATWPFNSTEKMFDYYMDLLNNPDRITQEAISNQPISSFEPVDKPNESYGGNAVSNAFADFFSYSILTTSVIPYGKNMNVVIALINDNGETISTTSVNIFGQAGTLTEERRYYYREVRNDIASVISVKPITKKFTVVFAGVNVNKITDNTMVKIISVNDRDSETIGMEGYIRITNGRL